MFPSGLKKTELWVALALLLLCLSICPHSTHPHFEEAEETMDTEEKNVENEEDDGAAVQDQDEDSEEEDDLVEDTEIENAPAVKPGDPYPGNPDPPIRARVCKKITEDCDWPYNCCPGLTCTELKCVYLQACKELDARCKETSDCCGDLLCFTSIVHKRCLTRYYVKKVTSRDDY